MKSYVDFTEPRNKIEYPDEPDRYQITSRHVRIPYASEVIAKSRREPRAKNVSPLLMEHLSGMKGKYTVSDGRERSLSESARKARNEVLKRLGIDR